MLNILCCGCQCDTGIKSNPANLFDEGEVYCYGCSSKMMEEEEVEPEPPTLRMNKVYPILVIELDKQLRDCSQADSTVYTRVGRLPPLRSTIGLSTPIGIYRG